jgi:hypothetical protein
MKYYLRIILLILLLNGGVQAQVDSSSQDPLYNRPFILQSAKTSTAVGGYMEANTNYFSEDGVSEGFSMEMRRFNIFLFSTVIPRVKFLAELEFEHGTEEITLETAQADIEFNPAFIFRAGIVVLPIGAFNQNHDSPKWEFIERPLVSTRIIPSTLSDVGFGFNGHLYLQSVVLKYDTYLVNGLNDGIILNNEGRTFLQSGKNNDRFAEDNNGSPAFCGRLALKLNPYGEIGFSGYSGIYNSYQIEGDPVDKKRMLKIFAADFNTTLLQADIRGEMAFNWIDVPAALQDIYGNRQYGAFMEIIYPVFKQPLFGFKKSVINIGVRGEYIDYNSGTFSSTGTNIYDEISAVAFSIGFRPSQNTVLRANYSYQLLKDILGNPAVQRAGFQFGLATYF